MVYVQCVKMSGDGTVEWEPGVNRSVEVSHPLVACAHDPCPGLSDTAGVPSVRQGDICIHEYNWETDW